MFRGSVTPTRRRLFVACAGLAAVLGMLLFAPFAFAQSTQQTINFNDRSGPIQQLNGQYPSGVINWGTAQWVTSPPWRKLTSVSISFNGATPRSATFSFVSPRRLISLVAYNGGTSSTTITVSCSGQPNAQAVIAPDTLTTITTSWTAACSPVSIASTNGWNTNYDDLVIDAGSDTVPPTVTATSP